MDVLAENIVTLALSAGIGMMSLAYVKKTIPRLYGISDFSRDKSIPMVAVRKGDSTHDAEFEENPDRFLEKCERQYGSVFNLMIQYQNLTCVSGQMAREVYAHENLNYIDHLNELTGLRSCLLTVTKSNNEIDCPLAGNIIKHAIVSKMKILTPGVVTNMDNILERDVGTSTKEKVIDNAGDVIQQMVGTAMAGVFLGPKAINNEEVINTFIHSAHDFGVLLTRTSRKLIKNAFGQEFKPLLKHVYAILRAITPILEDRRQEEERAIAQGREWVRPDDVLQYMFDQYEEIGFEDMEDMCGHILLIVLAAVHTTADSGTYLINYLAAFPEHIDTLYEEQLEILEEQVKHRQAARQEKLASGEVSSNESFVGTELDPHDDRLISPWVLKKLIKMDSFIREVLRYQLPRITATHRARADVTLSNGMVITKGTRATVNVHSVHQKEALQGPEPEEFRPWRFVGKNRGAVKAGTDFVVFGLGRHVCPGRELAIQDLKVIGSLLVSKYSKLEIVDKEKTKKMILGQLGDIPPSPIAFTSRG
ncbi:cytochrome P450 [Dissophora ornata]|nr:hypothetical protein BGZ58_005968 [Dissophora ornata]KAI8600009.1 cytochrome P450 [Dissophora ornata]